MIISLFLDINGSKKRKSNVQTDLNHLFDQERKLFNFNEEQKKQVRRDFKKVGDFVMFDLDQGYNRGLAAYSCQKINLWHYFYLPLPLLNELVLQFRPFIRPLMASFDFNRRYSVILLNRTQTRLFDVYLGKIDEVSEIFDEVPQRIKKGGWFSLSERRFERHTNVHLYNHFQRVNVAAVRMLREYKFDYLILAGEAENIAFFKPMLHSYLKERLIGEIPINQMDAPLPFLLEETMKIEGNAKFKEETSLAGELFDKKSGGMSVFGLEKTLEALKRGQVNTLIIAKDYEAPGIDEAIDLAIEKDCKVKFISSSLLKEKGSLAAILRYPLARAA